MDKEDDSRLDGHIRTVLTGVVTALLLWIGLTVQSMSSELPAVKTDIAHINKSLENMDELKEVVIENNQNIKDIDKRVDRLESKR